jgi:hypothetical protein
MWRKHFIFPPKTLWIATNYFVQSLSFDHQHNFFFPSWNVGFIIPLISITYLELVHNYNIIKYICFINPWQRADMHLCISWVCVCMCVYNFILYNKTQCSVFIDSSWSLWLPWKFLNTYFWYCKAFIWSTRIPMQPPWSKCWLIAIIQK